jgi:hypothetical protein
LVEEYGLIGLESLHVKGMMGNDAWRSTSGTQPGASSAASWSTRVIGMAAELSRSTRGIRPVRGALLVGQ